MPSSPTLRKIQPETAAPTPPRSPALRVLSLLGRSLGVFVIVVLLLLWYVGVFGGNLHTVVPGRVYRSAQLTGNTLLHALRRDHIGTVVNLRGKTPEDSWYWNEVGVCKSQGVAHVDIGISAVRLPPPRTR